MIATFPARAAAVRWWLRLLAALFLATGVHADTQDLVEQGQRAFQKGAFSQAAAHWEKAVDSFRAEKNATAEIATSVSLANACQSLGQQRRAVQILKDALVKAQTTGNLDTVTLVKSKLGAALVMTHGDIG